MYIKIKLALITNLLLQMVKTFESDRWLLGFREVCLSACAESSIWTKFCEVDLITSATQLLHNPSPIIPKDLIRLEYHLLQPVRTHNIGKMKFDLIRKNGTSEKNTITVEHTYVEGAEMYLSDLIVFPLIHICFNIYGVENISDILPLTCKWYNLMLSQSRILFCTKIFVIEKLFVNQPLKVPEVKMESLYKCDPKRCKTSEKLFTKQEDVDNALQIIDSINILHEYEYNFDSLLSKNFSWDDVPFHAHPKGGNLPDERLCRKMEQIENVVKAVLAVRISLLKKKKKQ